MALNITKIEQELAKQHRITPFSGVILIREKGQNLLEQCFGFANRVDALPNTIDTRFGVASGAKTFTSVAICQFFEQGLLSFDTLLKDCLNISFPQFDPAITVHHLLSHSSGIPAAFYPDTQIQTTIIGNTINAPWPVEECLSSAIADSR